MIRHTVFFKVKENTSNQKIESALNDFLELKNKLPGIITMMAGKCGRHEGKGEHLFTHAFSIDFKDQAAYDNFLQNPITHPAKDGIVNIVENGYDGLMGFDLEA